MSRDETPRILPAPPLAYTLYSAAPLSQGPQPTLVQLSVKRNGVIDVDAWFERHGLELPVWEIVGPAPTHPRLPPPALRGKLLDPFATEPPPKKPLPPEIPATFAGGSIVEAIRGPGCSIAIYRVGHDEHRVVVRDDAGELLGAFDLSAYGHVPADGGHSRQHVEWAQVQDGVLFVSTRHLGYASDSGGLNAFITAIALPTGDLYWRSESLVSNSYTFLVRDGWIITGYGFTAEPDFLFVIDGKTGEVVQRMPMKSGPEYILEKDGVLHVRTYDRDYRLTMRTK